MIRWLALAVLLLTVAVPGVWSAETLTTDVCFTPGEDCTGLIVRLLNEAKQEILVHAYSFTSAPIARALVQAHQRGVAVTVILDRSQGRDRSSQADFLAYTGVPTFIDRRHAVAHNKIVLIDRHTIVTGSFNYTRAAQEKNAENVLVLQGDQKLLQRYRENFELHKRHAKACAMTGIGPGETQQHVHREGDSQETGKIAETVHRGQTASRATDTCPSCAPRCSGRSHRAVRTTRAWRETDGRPLQIFN